VSARGGVRVCVLTPAADLIELKKKWRDDKAKVEALRPSRSFKLY
jgi:hypothetical protein